MPQVGAVKFVGADGVAFTGTMFVVCMKGVNENPDDVEAPLLTPGIELSSGVHFPPGGETQIKRPCMEGKLSQLE
jgi:hypothetical protein